MSAYPKLKCLTFAKMVGFVEAGTHSVVLAICTKPKYQLIHTVPISWRLASMSSSVSDLTS